MFEYIKSNSGEKSITIIKGIGMPKRTVERWLQKLKDINEIKYAGTPKTGGYYIVNQEIK